MTATAFDNPDDQWRRLLREHPELWSLTNSGTVPREPHLKTTDTSRVIVTEDGHLGLWLKLDPFRAAAWHSAIMHAECPTFDEDDPDLDWDTVAEAEVYHDMALHWLAERMVLWLLPMRRAFLELGWDQALLESDDTDD